MILNFRNILSLNERLAYGLVGKLRGMVLPFVNNFLTFQVNSISKKLISKETIIRKRITQLLPEVRRDDLLKILSEKERNILISMADDVILHEFNILSVPIKFQDKIDWHLDFNSNFRWPKGKLYTKYKQVELHNNADVKFPREFNRCHHFLYLGQAYILTKDEKYTKEFIYQVRDWIAENPYKKSINWGCSMDISLRACNWIYALRMFMDSDLIDDAFFHETITSLYLHGRFIYENPEKNRVYNHNHYLSDLAGQIMISLLFEDLKIDETQKWKEIGLYEFFREIRIQILPTGFTYEKTTNYHRLVTELIAYTIIILKNNNIEIPQDISFRIKKMFESILYYSFSDGMAPIIGDQDNGRFLPFFPYNINYQKYLMNVGAVLFSDGIFKYYSGENNIDVLFLTGQSGYQNYLTIKPIAEKLKSKAFPDAGFYILRSELVYLFINNSGLSHYSEVKGGTHTHSDLLSFVYSYNKTPFLIDPGTYVYSSNPKDRMKFRSTSMHNTLTVDDFNQNNLKESDLWAISRDAIPKEITWSTSGESDIYEGAHSGYERLTNPIKHNRKFELEKVNENVKITDRIEGIGQHNIKCHFHFDEKIDVKISDNSIYCRSESELIKISFDLQTNYFLEYQDEYISKGYNHKVLAPYVILKFKMNDSIELVTRISKSDD